MPRNEWKLLAPARKYGTGEFRSPTPNITDAVIVEEIPIRTSGYTPLVRGTPHPKVSQAIFVHDSPIIRDDQLVAVQRFYCTTRSAQDTYNGDITFDKGNAAYPIFKRVYFEPRSQAPPFNNPPAKGTILASLVGMSLTAGGTGYIGGGSGQIDLVFTGGTGSGASGVAEIIHGMAVAVCLTDGGSYTAAPSVAIDATLGGSGGAVSVQLQDQTCLLFDEVYEAAENEFADLFYRVTRSYKKLPGPLLTGYEQSPEYLIASTDTEQEVLAASTSLPSETLGSIVDISPIDSLRSLAKTKTVSSQIGTFYLTFPAKRDLSLPRVLAQLLITWSVGTGTGTYEEDGTGGTVGTSGALSLNAEGTGQGSASCLGDITPIFAAHPSENLPFLDYFFFLPNPVTLSSILTRASAIASALAGSSITVNDWLIFAPQEHSFFLASNKISVSARATARESMSFNTSGGGSASAAWSTGNGTSEDLGPNVKVITIQECIHAALAFSGPTSVSQPSSASAKAYLPPGTNWHGSGSATPTTIATAATGYVTPKFLGQTPVPGLPISGLYLYKPDVAVYNSGYSMVRAPIFDFSVIAYAQTTLADYSQLIGSELVTHAAGNGYVLPIIAGGAVGVWFQTGTETQPDFSAYGVTAYVQVTVSPTATSAAIATATVTAFSSSTYWTVAIFSASPTATQFTALTKGLTPYGFDVTSGSIISVLTPG